MENPGCRELGDKLADMKIEFERSKLTLWEAGQKIGEIERSIAQTERDLLIARGAELGGNIASGLLPNPLGSAVGVGTTVHSAFEISRLQGELRTKERDLERAEGELARVAQERRNYQANIPGLESYMRSIGCPVP